MVKWFLKNHDFIQVNSPVAGKYNTHKQNGSHLGFPIRIILATVDLQVIFIRPMNFESIALSVQRKVQNRFSRWTPWPQFGISYRNDLSYFLSPRCFRQSFESTDLSVQKKGKNRFSRCPPSWISDWNHFSYFYTYKSSRCFLPIFKSTRTCHVIVGSKQ